MTDQINDPKTQGLKSVTPIQAGMLHIYIRQFRSLAQDAKQRSLLNSNSEMYQAFSRGMAAAYEVVADSLTDALR